MTKENRKIVALMTDKERRSILRRRKLFVVVAEPEKITKVYPEGFKELETETRKDAKPVLTKLAQEFGVFKDYENCDIDLIFKFSRANLSESLTKQKGKYDNFALMLSVFDEVIKNAIGIEVHHDRYGDTTNLKNMYVLVSAFSYEGRIVPVKLEVKELKAPPLNSLYVAVTRSAFDMKKATVFGVSRTTVVAGTRPLVASSISIHQLFRKVNCLDKDLLKYVPNGFLNRGQKVAKSIALDEEASYLASLADCKSG